MMQQKIKEVFSYLANLQWTERPQPGKCKFCNVKASEIIVEVSIFTSFEKIHSNEY